MIGFIRGLRHNVVGIAVAKSGENALVDSGLEKRASNFVIGRLTASYGAKLIVPWTNAKAGDQSR